jgi:methyl-accepting chemotaxis protein
MNNEIAKALNALSVKINELARRIDVFFNSRCDTNKEYIGDNTSGIIDLANVSSEFDGAITEMAELLSEQDVAITELAETINSLVNKEE